MAAATASRGDQQPDGAQDLRDPGDGDHQLGIRNPRRNLTPMSARIELKVGGGG